MTVHDQLMSENIQDNILFAARVFPAGNFHFIVLAGPPLGTEMGPSPIRVPREAMLRELGLVMESPAPPQIDPHLPDAPMPIEDAPAKPGVPCDAPCPCGSGRKYKKGCGRES
ncbi:MAG: SEC-C metal-binding domain-containing protein [Phycisphaerales bacterium]